MNSLSQEGIGMTSQRTRERLVNRLVEQGIKQQEVLDAIRQTPRHLFVDEALAHRAYEDVSLPIGFDQTISQPYIVARMTEEIYRQVGREGSVLEIGTGCGYQTAVLARLFKCVYTLERIAPLQMKAKETLQAIGLNNIRYKVADGNYGWPQHSPFEGIIATAAAEQVPDYLARQLADNGTLVLPQGDDRSQQLMFYKKRKGELAGTALEPVFFVPFLSGIVR